MKLFFCYLVIILTLASYFLSFWMQFILNGGLSEFPIVFWNGLRFQELHSDETYWAWSLIIILGTIALYFYSKSLLPIAMLTGALIFYFYMIVSTFFK